MTELEETVDGSNEQQTTETSVGIARQNHRRQTIDTIPGTDGPDVSFSLPREENFEEGSLVEIEFNVEFDEFVRVEQFEPTEEAKEFHEEVLEKVQEIDGVGPTRAEEYTKTLPVFDVTDWSEVTEETLHGTRFSTGKDWVGMILRLARQEETDGDRVNAPHSSDNFVVKLADGRIINASNLVVHNTEVEVRTENNVLGRDDIMALDEFESIKNIGRLVPRREVKGFAEALTADEDRTAAEGEGAAYDILQDEKRDVLGSLIE